MVNPTDIEWVPELTHFQDDDSQVVYSVNSVLEIDDAKVSVN
jgi:hypothetical protein